MNDEKRRGRPPKGHLQDEHHFHAASEKPEEPVVEVLENPTIAPDVGMMEDTTMSFSENLANTATSYQSVQNATLAGDGLQNQESSIGEKIHQLVEISHGRTGTGATSTIIITASGKGYPDSENLNGWHLIESDAVLNSPPRNGNPVRLSESPHNEGVIAFWKRERAFANATKRWQEHGVWRDFYTGMKIDFEPKYWKERYV